MHAALLLLKSFRTIIYGSWSLIGGGLVLFGWLLVDDVHHLPLDRFLFQNQSVLVPDEVGIFCIDTLLLHTALEQTDDIAVIWILGEAKATAVVHEFSEFFRLILAQVINGCLFLFLLDGCVLLSLGSTWKSLPWQRAF